MPEFFDENNQIEDVATKEVLEAYIAVLREVQIFEKTQINGKHNLCKVSFKVGGSISRGEARLKLYPKHISFDDAHDAEIHKRDGSRELQIINIPSDIDVLVCARRVIDDGLVSQGDFTVIIRKLRELAEKIFNESRVLVSFDDIDRIGKTVSIDEAMEILNRSY